MLVVGGLNPMLATHRVWVAMFLARQILGPRLRPHYPPPGKATQEFFLAEPWLIRLVFNFLAGEYHGFTTKQHT